MEKQDIKNLIVPKTNLEITAKHALTGTASRGLAVPVIKEQTEQDEFVKAQQQMMEDYQLSIMRAHAELMGKASGNHPTRKPGSARVRAKLKKQKAAMKLEMAKKAKLKQDQESR